MSGGIPNTSLNYPVWEKKRSWLRTIFGVLFFLGGLVGVAVGFSGSPTVMLGGILFLVLGVILLVKAKRTVETQGTVGVWKTGKSKDKK